MGFGFKYKRRKWVSYPNGSCSYKKQSYGPNVIYEIGIDYYMDCVETYDSYDFLPIVSPRTLFGFEPQAYQALLFVFGGASVLLVLLALIALIFKRLPWNLKIYLLGGLLLSGFKGVQMFHNVACSLSIGPYNGTAKNSNERYFCLSLETSGFYWNQMVSSYGLAVLPIYRILIWSMILSRYIAMKRPDWFDPLRTAYLQVAVYLLGLPWFFLVQQGLMYWFYHTYRGGIYFHPLTFLVREHLPSESILAPKATGVNLASVFVDPVAAQFAYKTWRLLEKKASMVETRLQKLICAIHSILVLAWFFDIAYFVFVFSWDVEVTKSYSYGENIKITHGKAQMLPFILENLPGWMIAVTIPLLILGYAVRQDPKTPVKANEA